MYQELSLEEGCCHLSSQYTMGLARMVREDDHVSKSPETVYGDNEGND
jgi:hypothetical protein